MSSPGNANWLNAVRRHIGSAGVDFTKSRVGQTLHIRCARGHVVDVKIAGGMPPEFVNKKLLEKGWTCGHNPICPEHNRKRDRVKDCGTKMEEAAKVSAGPLFEKQRKKRGPDRQPRMRADKREKVVLEALAGFPSLGHKELCDLTLLPSSSLSVTLGSLIAAGAVTFTGKSKSNTNPARYSLGKPKEPAMPEATVTPITEATGSDAARAARRLAHMLLEEKFDVAAGQYRDGYSDKKVALETGASEAFVTRRREEEFAPLKMPSDLGAITQDVAAMNKRLTDELARIQSDAATAIGNLARDVGNIATRIETLVARNGWKS